RGFTRAGPFEHVADVAVAELPGAGEVGMAGTRRVHADDLLFDLGVDRPGVHPVFPVLVVAVGDQQRDRAAHRLAVADAGAHLGGVGLDAHASTPSVSQLAAGHVAVYAFAIQLQTGRKTLDNCSQAG